MVIVLIGPPGSGKGTQCKRLVEHFGIPHLSTGEMLREARSLNSPRAREISDFIDSGRLVSDDLIMQLLEDRLEQPDCARGCLLDGVPRTVRQGHMLEELFRRRGWMLDHVVSLEVPANELASRLASRAVVEHRKDDTPETMARRMQIFDQETAPLLEFYRRQGLLSRVVAVGTPDEVFGKILSSLKKIDDANPNGVGENRTARSSVRS